MTALAEQDRVVGVYARHDVAIANPQAAGFSFGVYVQADNGIQPSSAPSSTMRSAPPLPSLSQASSQGWNRNRTSPPGRPGSDCSSRAAPGAWPCARRDRKRA